MEQLYVYLANIAAISVLILIAISFIYELIKPLRKSTSSHFYDNVDSPSVTVKPLSDQQLALLLDPSSAPQPD